MSFEFRNRLEERSKNKEGGFFAPFCTILTTNIQQQKTKDCHSEERGIYSFRCNRFITPLHFVLNDKTTNSSHPEPVEGQTELVEGYFLFQKTYPITKNQQPTTNRNV